MIDALLECHLIGTVRVGGSHDGEVFMLRETCVSIASSLISRNLNQ